MDDKLILYRKALPFWVAMALISALVSLVNPGGNTGRGQLLAGLEPLIIVRAVFERPKHLGQVMLSFGLPAMAQRAGEQDPLYREDLNLTDMFWSLAVGVRYHTPQETLRAGLPVLGYRPVAEVPAVKPPPQRTEQLKPSAPPAPPPTPPAESNRPLIIVFHTHTSESFLPISGRTHLENGIGDIVSVGERLAAELRNEGFEVVHDQTINDMVPFRDAYRRSLVTAEKLLSAHPDPLALLDIHRDATPGVVGTIELDGKKVARLALVVGTDRLGLPHPGWRKNLAFANSIRDAAEQLYPGLVARIDVQDARYNQHLHSRAIIVEVGNQYSTEVEVYRAAACLAKILTKVASFYE